MKQAQPVIVTHLAVREGSDLAACGSQVTHASSNEYSRVPRHLCDGCRLAATHGDTIATTWMDRKQEQSGTYVDAAWPGETILHAALGLNEEVTELVLAYHASRITRAVLKRAHGTRGSYADWTEEVRKEAADVLLVLLDIARREDFSLAKALIERQAEIEARDINHDPITPKEPVRG